MEDGRWKMGDGRWEGTKNVTIQLDGVFYLKFLDNGLSM
jgi:hypothetical protein